jgi:predicted nucleotidyltransferase
MENFDHGISERTLETLSSLFLKYSGIRKAVLYGSRASAAARDASDIDIALFTDGAFTHSDLLHFYGDVDDSDIPYTVDVSLYNELNNPVLKEHIRRFGKVLFSRGQNDQLRREKTFKPIT